jgi:hypothetical protein
MSKAVQFVQRNHAGAMLVLALTACGGPRESAGDRSKTVSVEDVSSIVAEGNGYFRVTCIDGRVEQRTASEIRANQVCMRGGPDGPGLYELRCIARDNDGRNPWILGAFDADASLLRFPQFLYATNEACQSAIAASVDVGFRQTKLFCAPRDVDGNPPWSFGVVALDTPSLATQIVFADVAQCQTALSSARPIGVNLVTCAPRDSDGNPPWAYVSVTSGGEVRLQAGSAYPSFQECADSL